MTLEEKYSLIKFEGLINKLRMKLEYNQTEWITTVELLRQSIEFVIFAEKYDKDSYLKFMQDNNMYDIFIEVLFESNNYQVYS